MKLMGVINPPEPNNIIINKIITRAAIFSLLNDFSSFISIIISKIEISTNEITIRLED